LKDDFASPDDQEDDIFLVRDKNTPKSENLQPKFKEELGFSLKHELSFTFIDFPKNVNIKVNGL